ncbi:hypothetical protein EVAR_22078_1 [Eumeta japonica]|uniref:Uncharacterized protein n=1 Tax=Eumeta variegata TaxID=151549 RepID=A0A4C1UU05_EUMVA|nr:hypothetical protein EVAR_22078_1 [Eumeta japonica]
MRLYRAPRSRTRARCKYARNKFRLVLHARTTPAARRIPFSIYILTERLHGGVCEFVRVNKRSPAAGRARGGALLNAGRVTAIRPRAA